MAVLPESMDRLNVQDVPKSLSIIQEYIRYMGERIEFSFRNMTKTVSSAGVSSAELYILVQAQAQQLAALNSVVSGAVGNITELQSNISALQTAVSDLKESVAALDVRVTALENPEPEPEPPTT